MNRDDIRDTLNHKGLRNKWKFFKYCIRLDLNECKKIINTPRILMGPCWRWRTEWFHKIKACICIFIDRVHDVPDWGYEDLSNRYFELYKTDYWEDQYKFGYTSIGVYYGYFENWYLRVATVERYKEKTR